jgi:hypothetical protein
MMQPLCVGPGENDADGDGHGTTLPAASRVKHPVGKLEGDALGDGVGQGTTSPLMPIRQPVGIGTVEDRTVGDGHGTGELPPVDVRQPGDGLDEGRTVGEGHGLGPFGVEMRQFTLGDGAGLDDAVGVGHGATVPPDPTRHEGDGLGAATAAPLTPPCAVGSTGLLPLPPPPAQAAVSVAIPRMRPSLRIAWTPDRVEPSRKPQKPAVGKPGETGRLRDVCSPRG